MNEERLSPRLSITIRQSLLQRMDEFARQRGLSRSGLISIAVEQYMTAVEMQPDIQRVLSGMAALQSSALSGNLSADDVSKLEAEYDALKDRSGGCYPLEKK